MFKHFGSIVKASSPLFHGEFERFWAIFSHWFLPKYFEAWHSIFGRYPRPRKAEGIAQDPIMIYQMAKVGSRSVLFSLELSYRVHRLPNVPIHHVHNLVDLDAHEERARITGNTEEIQVIQQYKKLRQEFDQLQRQHWNIISLVRDPVARNVGTFFHNIGHYIPNWKTRWREDSLSLDEVVESFLNHGELHHTANVWFDVEFKSVLGIDVYAIPFQRQTGYQFYANKPRVDLLLIRLEDLDRVADSVMEKFLGLRDFKLYPSNIGDEKDYAEIYRAFKATPLPLSYVEKTYQVQFARHFYTDEELQAFTRKWTHPKVRAL